MKIAMRGVWTALISPFTPSGQLDLAAFRDILKDQKSAGVNGVVVSGTTGESPTLTLAEKKELIRIALEELKDSGVGVMAGTGSNNTAETIEFSSWASDAGVDGLLLVTPYYNKPTQAGLRAHFLAVADAVSCDIMLYNVPGRASVALSAETIATLAGHHRIVALKDASGNVSFTTEVLDALDLAGHKLFILSGDDVNFLPSLAVGAQGVVSVASNLFPRAMIAIQKAYESGQRAEALRIHQKHFPLFRDLFIESNPGPIKAAMKHSGWCEAKMRPPLAPLSESSMRKLEESLLRCGVLPGRRPL